MELPETSKDLKEEYDDLEFLLEVSKQKANFVRDKLRSLDLQGKYPLQSRDTAVWIHLKRELSETELKLLSDELGTELRMFKQQMNNKKKNKKESIVSPIDTLTQELSKEGVPSSIFPLLPKKWERIGHVLTLKNLPEELTPYLLQIGNALVKSVKGVQTVLLDKEGIKGELRQPELQLIVNISNSPNPTETTHIENNVKYRIDVGRVMFSSGNGTERIHFASIQAKNELIVDMFAGIGYFSIPLALHSNLNHIYCLEKNPDSFHYLSQNIKLNGVEKVVTAYLGDNRQTCNEMLGKADRVLMGYIPTPKGFLQRAFDFLKKEGGILHYHHTCTKEEYRTMATQHIQEELDNRRDSRSFSILDFRVVKSYSPKVFHCVADVLIK